MGKSMTDRNRDNILSLLDKGFKVKEIVDILGWAPNTIYYVKNFAKLAREHSLEELEKQRENHEPLYQWAYRKFIGTPEPIEITTTLPYPQEVTSNRNEEQLINLLGELTQAIKETNQLLRELK